jgi:hypothetical protein
LSSVHPELLLPMGQAGVLASAGTVATSARKLFAASGVLEALVGAVVIVPVTLQVAFDAMQPVNTPAPGAVAELPGATDPKAAAPMLCAQVPAVPHWIALVTVAETDCVALLLAAPLTVLPDNQSPTAVANSAAKIAGLIRRWVVESMVALVGYRRESSCAADQLLNPASVFGRIEGAL